MAINEINSDFICVISLILLFSNGLANFLFCKRNADVAQCGPVIFMIKYVFSPGLD
jgi:hypothetical protein